MKLEFGQGKLDTDELWRYEQDGYERGRNIFRGSHSLFYEIKRLEMAIKSGDDKEILYLLKDLTLYGVFPDILDEKLFAGQGLFKVYETNPSRWIVIDQKSAKWYQQNYHNKPIAIE